VGVISTLIGLGIVFGYGFGAAFTGRAAYSRMSDDNWDDAVAVPAGIGAAAVWPVAGPVLGLISFMKAPSRKRELAIRAEREDLNARINLWHDLVMGLPQNSTERTEAYKHVQELRIQRDRL
jgi:hypothetical protein